MLRGVRYVIYRAFNTVTGKSYVGVTNNYQRRLAAHMNRLRHNNHHSSKLQKSYNKHGEKVFVWEIVEFNVHPRKRESKEIQWIALLDSYRNGYNMTEGGGGSGGRNRACVWNGIEYQSMTIAAKQLGLTHAEMRGRVNRGETCDADLYTKNAKPCTWNGIEYPSITDAARAVGVTKQSMSQRLARGWACDADIGKPRPIGADEDIEMMRNIASFWIARSRPALSQPDIDYIKGL